MVAFKIVLCCVQALLCAVTVKLEVVSHGNQGLVTVPFDAISVNVTTLVLNGNAISAIDEFLFYPHLKKLWLARNSLSVFPNLANVSQTLMILGLPDNNLYLVPAERVNVLTVLNYLNLTNNRLNHFPNVPGPGATLASLYLDANLFTQFPNLTAIGRRLGTIGLRHNFLTKINLNFLSEGREHKTNVLITGNTNLTRIPNLGFWNLKELEMYEMKLICDCNFGWINMAEAAGIVVQMEEAPCSMPNKLLDEHWGNISLADLNCQGM